MTLCLHDFVVKAVAADELPALNTAFQAYAGGLGFDAIAYAIDRYGYEQVEDISALALYTFPEGWFETYIENTLYECDPVIRRARSSFLPFHWFDLEQERPPSACEEAYFASLRAVGFVDGVALAIFGPTGTAAYFSLGSRSAPLTLSDVQLRELQSACHHMHVRTLELRGRAGQVSPLLSSRETEVLQWVARGKSNAVIADILGVSPHTVDTVMRRSYSKLGVSNRISAVLRAASNGLISA